MAATLMNCENALYVLRYTDKSGANIIVAPTLAELVSETLEQINPDSVGIEVFELYYNGCNMLLSSVTKEKFWKHAYAVRDAQRKKLLKLAL